MTSAKTGRCLCGAVRFMAEGVDLHFHACHCEMCRRWASGPVFCAYVKSVTFDGVDSLVRYDSSAWGQRGFCKSCGTSLFYFLKPRSMYAMCVGTFDDQASFRLAEEIYVDEKPPGYELFPGEHPRLTKAEVLAKFNAG